MQALSNIRTALYEEGKSGASSSMLKTPKEARKEVERLRDELANVRDFKEQQRFLGKRERIISKGWRHGIVGVDDADSGTSQVFYESARAEKKLLESNKKTINDRR